MPTHHPRRGALLALLILSSVATALVIHRIHVLRPTESPYFGSSDVYAYFYPNALFLQAELRQGNLPTWNPYQFAGEPFLGLHVTGSLYPPNLVAFALLGGARGLEALFLAHLVIAGFFTWLFARRLGLGFAPSLAGALANALSLPAVFGFYQPAILSCIAWLPAIFWATHGLASERRLRWAVALGAFAALGFLSGHAQGFLYEAQFAACYGLFALFALCPHEHRIKTIGLAALAGLLAFCWVAPQLLPALELTRESVRGLGGISFEEMTHFLGMPMYATPRGLAKEFLGVFAPESPYAFNSSFNVPLLTLPLIAAGVLSPRHRRHWLLLASLLGAVALIVLGPATPVCRLYYSLPLGNLFRDVTRMNFVYVFLASTLLAIGIEAVAERLRAAGMAPRGIAALAGLLLAATVGDSYLRTELPWSHPSVSDATRRTPSALTDFLRGSGGHSRVFIETYRTHPHYLNHKLGTLLQLPVVPDYEPNPPGRYRRYFEARTSPPWHGGVTLLGRNRSKAPDTFLGLLDLMSVRYYAAPRALPQNVEALGALLGTPPQIVGDFAVFERTSALPRAYVVHELLPLPDEFSVMQLLKRRGFRPRDEAVVIDPTPSPRTRVGTGEQRDREQAVIVAHGSEQVTVEAFCVSACMLVLTDLDYPGWRAHVDGREAPIHRVNLLFRGVELEAGKHRVVYRYEPLSFRIGSAFALAAIGAVVVFAGRSWLRRR